MDTELHQNCKRRVGTERGRVSCMHVCQGRGVSGWWTPGLLDIVLVIRGRRTPAQIRAELVNAAHAYIFLTRRGYVYIVLCVTVRLDGACPRHPAGHARRCGTTCRATTAPCMQHRLKRAALRSGTTPSVTAGIGVLCTAATYACHGIKVE